DNNVISGCHQIFEPAHDLFAFEVLVIGMTQWNIDLTDVVDSAIRDADADEVASMPRPHRTALVSQSVIAGLGIQGDDAHSVQVGQLARRLPFAGHGHTNNSWVIAS